MLENQTQERPFNMALVRISTLRAVEGTDVMAGFIHVPCSPELAAGTGNPSLEIDDIARGLTIAIEVSLAELARR
jgi:pyrrolidone-carboxylate peptidase